MDQPPSRNVASGRERHCDSPGYPLLYSADGNPIDHREAKATPDKDREPPPPSRSKDAAFWQAVFSGFLVITTIVHAYYYNRQWEAMKGQLEAAKLSAAAAMKAADVAEQTLRSYEAAFEVSSRPYVTVYKARLVRPLKTGERIQIDAQIRNSGNTPAFAAKATIAVGFVDTREPLWFEPPGHTISPSPHSDVPSNIERPLIFASDNPMPGDLMVAVNAKTHVLYFYGDYSYSSLTKAYGPFRFCFYDDPNFRLGGDDGLLSVCTIKKYDRTDKAKAKHKF